MSISACRDGLKARLATISGLYTFDTVPAGDIRVPAGVVGLADSIVEYDTTFGGSATYNFRIRIYVSRTSERTGQDEIDAYIAPSGAKSVYAAIEADDKLGGAASSTKVIRARGFGSVSVGGVDYLAVDFDVEVFPA